MITSPLQVLDENLWLMDFPLKMLGMNLHRVVTVIRLASGKLIVHSSAPFTSEDVAQIQSLGEVAWLIDALIRHDTFTQEGVKAFPDAVYLVPDGFPQIACVRASSLLPAPPEWADEIAVLSIDGAPEFGEIVMLHRPTRTLLVCDLVFNFSGEEGFLKKCLLHLATVGGHYNPGVTKPFKKAIKDPAAFAVSIRTLLSWDFDRVVVGHGVPISSGGKEKLRMVLQSTGISGV